MKAKLKYPFRSVVQVIRKDKNMVFALNSYIMASLPEQTKPVKEKLMESDFFNALEKAKHPISSMDDVKNKLTVYRIHLEGVRRQEEAGRLRQKISKCGGPAMRLS